jgi:ABC-type nitrate/sulfonate/bicarbonate transport system permease component
MTQLSKKESIWSAVIGTLIGAMCGITIGLSMFKEAKRCQGLKRENQILKEMIMKYQEQPLCGE